MADEAAEQKLHTELCRKISEVLDGCEYDVGFDALAAVQARLCAETDHPEDSGLAQIGNFLQYLQHEIETIPAERIINIPDPN